MLYRHMHGRNTSTAVRLYHNHTVSSHLVDEAVDDEIQSSLCACFRGTERTRLDDVDENKERDVQTFKS